MQHQLFINGELVNGEGEKQAVYNPATGEVLLEIAEASPAQSMRRCKQQTVPLPVKGANHAKSAGGVPAATGAGD